MDNSAVSKNLAMGQAANPRSLQQTRVSNTAQDGTTQNSQDEEFLVANESNEEDADYGNYEEDEYDTNNENSGDDEDSEHSADSTDSEDSEESEHSEDSEDSADSEDSEHSEDSEYTNTKTRISKHYNSRIIKQHNARTSKQQIARPSKRRNAGTSKQKNSTETDPLHTMVFDPEDVGKWAYPAQQPDTPPTVQETLEFDVKEFFEAVQGKIAETAVAAMNKADFALPGTGDNLFNNFKCTGKLTTEQYQRLRCSLWIEVWLHVLREIASHTNDFPEAVWHNAAIGLTQFWGNKRLLEAGVNATNAPCVRTRSDHKGDQTLPMSWNLVYALQCKFLAEKQRSSMPKTETALFVLWQEVAKRLHAKAQLRGKLGPHLRNLEVIDAAIEETSQYWRRVEWIIDNDERILDPCLKVWTEKPDTLDPLFQQSDNANEMEIDNPQQVISVTEDTKYNLLGEDKKILIVCRLVLLVQISTALNFNEHMIQTAMGWLLEAALGRFQHRLRTYVMGQQAHQGIANPNPNPKVWVAMVSLCPEEHLTFEEDVLAVLAPKHEDWMHSVERITPADMRATTARTERFKALIPSIDPAAWQIAEAAVQCLWQRYLTAFKGQEIRNDGENLLNAQFGAQLDNPGTWEPADPMADPFESEQVAVRLDNIVTAADGDERVMMGRAVIPQTETDQTEPGQIEPGQTQQPRTGSGQTRRPRTGSGQTQQPSKRQRTGQGETRGSPSHEDSELDDQGKIIMDAMKTQLKTKTEIRKLKKQREEVEQRIKQGHDEIAGLDLQIQQRLEQGNTARLCVERYLTEDALSAADEVSGE